jgi:Helicase HerA, central domain
LATTTQFRLPDTSDRTAVIGRTGSGKSHFAAWLLSTQNFDEMPWIIIDFKHEHSDIINQIPRVQYLSYSDPLPIRPGLYMLKARTRDKDEMHEWLERILANGNIGLFFDEVFPIGQWNHSFNEIMMQGRSRNVPVIVCTQRPSNVSTYCFSEATFYYIFDVTKVSDRKKINEEIPLIPRDYKLEEYNSFYYDVPKKVFMPVKPAPDAKTIIENIDEKNPYYRRTL